MNKLLVVRSFPDSDIRELNEIESRLMLLGFIDGQKITVAKRAPFFRAPLLVEVRGRMIALNLNEAMLVKVEVVE